MNNVFRQVMDETTAKEEETGVTAGFWTAEKEEK